MAQLEALAQSFSRSQKLLAGLKYSKGWKEDLTQRAHLLMVSVRKKKNPTYYDSTE